MGLVSFLVDLLMAKPFSGHEIIVGLAKKLLQLTEQDIEWITKRTPERLLKAIGVEPPAYQNQKNQN